MEKYYYMSAGCSGQYIETQKIRKHLLETMFLCEIREGDFLCKTPFVSLTLLNVRNTESWSSNDYDAHKTNYISIVIEESYCENSAIISLFRALEKICGWTVIEDLC